MTELPRIGMLWMEGALSWLEQLCVVSFRDAGHEVVLYHYGPLQNVPDGIALANAAEILPREGGGLAHARTGSPALHSDLFRYRLLAREPGMIWADTDAYCLRPFTTETGHFHGWESDKHINGGVLGLPADSATLSALLAFTSDEFAIPPWYDDATKTEYAQRAAQGDPVHASEMTWGVWGPHALTHFLHATGEVAHSFPRHVLYPFTFADRRKMLKRRVEEAEYLKPDTLSVHFYGRRMRKRLVEREDGLPPSGSLIGRLVEKHGVDPAQAPLPVAAPVVVEEEHGRVEAVPDEAPTDWPVEQPPAEQIAKRHARMTKRAQDWLDQNLGGQFRRTCTVCRYEGRFAPYRNLLDARCPSCNSRPHHRLFVLWLMETRPIDETTRLLHFAPEWGLRPILQWMTPNYTSADIGDRGDLQIDIEATGLPNDAYNAIICHQVIEHVDDAKALAEMYRMLAPGGFAVLTTPVVEGWDETYENPAIETRAGRILHFGQGDHTRFYGRDFRDRIRAAGFELEEYTAVEPHVAAHALDRGGKLFIARKPSAT